MSIMRINPEILQKLYNSNINQNFKFISPLSFKYPYMDKTSTSEGFYETIPSERFYETISEVDQTSPSEGFYETIPENKKGLGSLLDLIMNLKIPGFSILKNIFNRNKQENQIYQQFDPRGFIKNGIYNIDDVSVPVEMVNDAYNPKTQFNRFERARDKFKDTGGLLDLFAASRTGTEFSDLKKILDYQKKQGTVDRSFIDRPKSERSFTGSGITGMGRNPDRFK